MLLTSSVHLFQVVFKLRQLMARVRKEGHIPTKMTLFFYAMAALFSVVLKRLDNETIDKM